MVELTTQVYIICLCSIKFISKKTFNLNQCTFCGCYYYYNGHTHVHLLLFFLQPLYMPNRVLVGEGVLSKMCRKKAKPRQFFLFNDILVYGNIVINKKKVSSQLLIDFNLLVYLTILRVLIIKFPDQNKTESSAFFDAL